MLLLWPAYRTKIKLIHENNIFSNFWSIVFIDFLLSERDTIADTMQHILDEATDPWGIKVERVEVKDVRLPQNLQRSMAAEAEATRDAQAKIIAAKGEMDASKALKEAADVIAQSPGALQLRYLQTLTAISSEKNSTIVFPLPIEMMKGYVKNE